MFKSVVVGADDSSTARQAVIAAAEIAQLAGGKLHIVTAYDPKAVRTDDLPVEFRELGNVNPADALLEGWPRSPRSAASSRSSTPARVGPPRRSSGSPSRRTPTSSWSATRA